MIPQNFKLSPREFQIYSLSYSGLTRVEVAERLSLKYCTVRAILRRVSKSLSTSPTLAVGYLASAGYLTRNPLCVHLSMLKTLVVKLVRLVLGF